MVVPRCFCIYWWIVSIQLHWAAPFPGLHQLAQHPSHSTDARGTSPVEAHVPKDFRHILVGLGGSQVQLLAEILPWVLREHPSPSGLLLNEASWGGANAAIHATRLHQGKEENLKAQKTENIAKKQLKWLCGCRAWEHSTRHHSVIQQYLERKYILSNFRAKLWIGETHTR